MRVIVAVTGASGLILAKRFLEVLNELGIESHLVMSDSSKKVMQYEKISSEDLQKLATKTHAFDEIDASIASGSFETKGMVIIPCSMKTIAGLASGFTDNLILRAGDVCLKENRKLILIPRETPLSYIHLKNMLTLRRAGATILPPNLTFYQEPKDMKDLINFIVGRTLDSLEIEHSLYKKWEK